MSHLPPFITDLGLILSVAAVTTLVFKRIKQPVVLGYIIAGFLVGPHVAFVPTVIDETNVRTWSEIGVIFLLFGLGLEFSFKKLVQVGGAATVTALTTVVFMLGAGYCTGQALGWSSMDSLFLGGILSISSTTIIIRAFDEMGLKTQAFARLVVGVLVIEDLVAILLLVLLSTVAVSKQFSGGELMLELGKLGFFLMLWFVGGIVLIPTVLDRTRRFMNDEMLLIVSIALCLAMAYLASLAGFSAALGAFIMGSILAETLLAERIEHVLTPVKDLFGAIFFVSVGMLIDPQVLLVEWPTVLLISAVILVGQPLSSGLGALLAGQPLKRSVQAGMSLSQIGEFSFIIATLGVSLGVTSPLLYPIAVAVSVVTTFVSPFMIRASSSTSALLERALPASWVAAVERYSQQTEQVKVTSDWRKLLRAYGLNLIAFLLLSLALIFIGSRYLPPRLEPGVRWLDGTFLAGLTTLVAIVPCIWAMSFRRIQRDAYRHLWLNKRSLRGPLVAIEVVRLAVAIVVLAILVNVFFGTGTAFIAALIVLVAAMLILRTRLQSFYQRVEAHFLLNFYQRERRKQRPALAPWDLHLAEIELPGASEAVGRSLQELRLRERFGVNVALIERGERTIPVPQRDERLLPGDNLVLIGTDEQLAETNKTLTAVQVADEPEVVKADIQLAKYRVLPRSPLIGLSIRRSGIREMGRSLVTGIERGDERIINPESDVVFVQDDLIWLVGDAEAMHAFMAGGNGVLE